MCIGDESCVCTEVCVVCAQSCLCTGVCVMCAQEKCLVFAQRCVLCEHRRSVHLAV